MEGDRLKIHSKAHHKGSPERRTGKGGGSADTVCCRGKTGHINTFSWVTPVTSTPSLILFRFISTRIFWISVCSSHPPSFDCSLMLSKKILCSRLLFYLAQEKIPPQWHSVLREVRCTNTASSKYMPAWPRFTCCLQRYVMWWHWVLSAGVIQDKRGRGWIRPYQILTNRNWVF